MELDDWDYGFVFGVGAGVGLFGSAGLGWRTVEITALVPCNTPRVSSPASMAWPIVMRVRALRLKAKLAGLKAIPRRPKRMDSRREIGSRMSIECVQVWCARMGRK